MQDFIKYLATLFESKKAEQGRSFAKSKFLTRPGSLAIDKNGLIYVTDSASNRIFVISKDFKEIDIFLGNGYNGLKLGRGESASIPSIEFMDFDSVGNMIATIPHACILVKVTSKGDLSIFAGSSRGYVDGPLASAKFDLPGGILIDESDNIFVSELAFDINGGNRIRKISNTSIVTTIAGGSGRGLVDGQGQDAKFNNPQKMVFDQMGNILIGDTENHAIRILNSTGYVHTLAGGNGEGLRDGSFDTCKFKLPRSLIVDDAGDIYVGDRGNSVIRKLLMKTKTVVTVAGNGFVGFYDGLGKDSQFDSIQDLKFAPDKINILVVDNQNSAIRNYNTKSTMVSTVVERANQGLNNGFGGNALIFGPTYLTLDKHKDLYVSDSKNHMIRKISIDGLVSTFSGFGGVSGYLDGSKSEALFNGPGGICFDDISDSFFVMDNGNNRVRQVFRNGSATTVAGSGEPGQIDGFGLQASLNMPNACTLVNEHLYFTEAANHQIRRVNIKTFYVETWAGIGSPVYINGPRLSSGMNYPTGLCSDPTGNLFFTDQYNEIRKIDINGVVSSIAGNAYNSNGNVDGVGSNARFSYPEGLACSRDGEIFVADKFNAIIRKVLTSSRAVTTYAGKSSYWGDVGKRTGLTKDSQFSIPFGVTVSENGDLYIADNLDNSIKVVERSSGRVKALAGTGAPHYIKGTIIIDGLRNSQGIFVHPITSQIFIADTENNLILKWENEQMKIFAGSGSDGWFDNPMDKRDSEFFYPHAIALSRNRTGLLIADTYNHVIREITDIGVLTIAGTGDSGNVFGAALSSKFNLPKDIVLDSSGNIFVTDSGNHLVKRISTNNVVTNVAGMGIAGFKDGRSTQSLLNHPIGLTFDSQNNLWIVDSFNHAIRLMNFTSNMLTTIAGTGDPGFEDGTRNATFKNPTGVVFDEGRDRVYICDTGNNAIRVIFKDGGPFYKVSTIVSQNLHRPSDLVLASENHLLILDAGQNALKLFSLNKHITSTTVTSFSSGLSGIEIGIIVTMSICCIFGFISYLLVLRRNSMKKKGQMELTLNNSNTPKTLTVNIMTNKGMDSNNVTKLMAVSQRYSNSNEASNTVNLSKSVAVALPGYLLIEDLHGSISFHSKDGLDSKMNSGGTATVHKGSLVDKTLISRHQIIDVAVKLMAGDRMIGSQIFESFKYEVSLMSSLPPSPYLVKLIGYCIKPMAIVMKSYAMSLQEALDRCDFFPNQLVKLKAVKEIAMGMQIIHSKDIIHFDLKPGNILIDIKSDMGFNFLVCDFGFADYAPEADRQFVAGMKRPSIQGITPRYAAPELFVKTALGSVSYIDYKKVDVYAYALIALYVATGEKPWGNLKPPEIEENVLKGNRPETPETFLNDWSFISECWCQDPNTRVPFDKVIEILSNK